MSSVRWTEEQLQNYQRLREKPKLEAPIEIVVPQPKVSKIERRFAQQLADNPDTTVASIKIPA